MHFLALAFISLAGAVTAVVLAVRALLAGIRRRGWKRVAILLACSGAVALYVWGVLHLVGAVAEAEDGGTDSSPLRPCREGGYQITSQVVGYDVNYLWLSFDCRLSDGGAYKPSVVPGYVNPAALFLGVSALVLAAVPTDRTYA